MIEDEKSIECISDSSRDLDDNLLIADVSFNKPYIGWWTIVDEFYTNDWVFVWNLSRKKKQYFHYETKCLLVSSEIVVLSQLLLLPQDM